jgi:hypothetical protein
MPRGAGVSRRGESTLLRLLRSDNVTVRRAGSRFDLPALRRLSESHNRAALVGPRRRRRLAPVPDPAAGDEQVHRDARVETRIRAGIGGGHSVRKSTLLPTRSVRGFRRHLGAR